MALLQFYFYDNSYQTDAYTQETGTELLEENIRLAKEIAAAEIEQMIYYRKSTDYWAEITIPDYGQIRVKHDEQGFAYWDIVKNPTCTWVPVEFLKYTATIIE